MGCLPQLHACTCRFPRPSHRHTRCTAADACRPLEMLAAKPRAARAAAVRPRLAEAHRAHGGSHCTPSPCPHIMQRPPTVHTSCTPFPCPHIICSELQGLHCTLRLLCLGFGAHKAPCAAGIPGGNRTPGCACAPVHPPLLARRPAQYTRARRGSHPISGHSAAHHVREQRG